MSRRNYGWLRWGRAFPNLARDRQPWVARFSSYGTRHPIRYTKRKTR